MLKCCILYATVLYHQVDIFVRKTTQEQQKHLKQRHRHPLLSAVSISSNAPSNTRLLPFLLLISSNSSREALLKLQPVKSSLSVLSPFSVCFSAITWARNTHCQPLRVSLSFTLINRATASSVRTDLLRSSLLRQENIRANCSPVWSSIACREFW